MFFVFYRKKWSHTIKVNDFLGHVRILLQSLKVNLIVVLSLFLMNFCTSVIILLFPEKWYLKRVGRHLGKFWDTRPECSLYFGKFAG